MIYSRLGRQTHIGLALCVSDDFQKVAAGSTQILRFQTWFMHSQTEYYNKESWISKQGSPCTITQELHPCSSLPESVETPVWEWKLPALCLLCTAESSLTLLNVWTWKRHVERWSSSHRLWTHGHKRAGTHIHTHARTQHKTLTLQRHCRLPDVPWACRSASPPHPRCPSTSPPIGSGTGPLAGSYKGFSPPSTPPSKSSGQTKTHLGKKMLRWPFRGLGFHDW